MVVSELGWFDRRIAEVVTDDGTVGYLRVKLQRSVWSNGKSDVGVDLSVVLQHVDGWTFSDRADPEPDDAQEELQSGTIEWFGRQLRIARWLGDAEAALIGETHFA